MRTRVLVIGGHGFIGTELVKQLLDRDYLVRVVDKVERPAAELHREYEFIRTDVCDKRNALNVLRDAEICVNLASRSGGIGYLDRYPATILNYNTRVCSSVFEAAAECNLKRMIYISSSAVYDSSSALPSREQDVSFNPPPISGYSFSKLVGEWYCRVFLEEFGLQYTIIRPFNSYGPTEPPGKKVGDAHVIPDLVFKTLSGQYPLELLGNGQQTRCFTHVSDIAHGILRTIESDKAVNEDFNLSSSREITIIELANMLWELCSRREEFQVSFVPAFRYDVQRRVADVSKAKELLGWETQIELEDGLRQVVKWQKQRNHDLSY